MPLRRIRYDGEDHFTVQDGGTIYVTNKFLILSGPEEWLAPVGLTSLATALHMAGSEETGDLFISTDTPERFDAKYPDHLLDTHLQRTADRKRIGVVLPVERTWDANENEVRRELSELLAPLVYRHRGTNLNVVRNRGAEQWFEVSFEILARGKTVADALRIGSEMDALLKAVSGGSLTLLSAIDLVRAGHASALLGLPEGAWFDGKSAPYPLTTDVHKWELAKDVASFANSDQGGLILLGARTKPERDGDVVHALTDFDLNLVDPGAYRRVLTARVHPQVEGLDIRTVAASGGRGIAYVFIPPQPEEIKPFIVKGVVAGRTVRAVHVSIPTRDGEDTRYADSAEVHALLQAGRVALRRSTKKPRTVKPAASRRR